MRTRRGFILVAALWMLVAFSAMALHFGLSARAQRLAINNASDRLISGSAAQSALTYAIHELRVGGPVADSLRHTSSADRDPWRVFHGMADTLVLGSVTAVIHYSDAGSVVYPATMSDDRLRAFFRAVEQDSLLADSAAAVVRGAESLDGIALPGCLGAGWGADERLTLVMTARVADVIERALPMIACVGDARINVQTAPFPVLMALPGVGSGAASAIMTRRSQDRLGGVLDISPDLLAPDRALFLSQVPLLLAVASSSTRAMIVRIEIRATASSHALVVEAVLNRANGYPTTLWRRIT